MPLLNYLNALAAVASTLASFVALSSPSNLSGTPPNLISPGERFFTKLYSARAIPFGLLAGILPFYYPGEKSVGWTLLAAAAVQAADVSIAVAKGDLKVIPGAGLGALIHGLAGWSLL